MPPHYKIRVMTCASGGRVGPPNNTRCVAHIINPAIIHEWEKKDGVMTTTNSTFHGVGISDTNLPSCQPSHGGDNKTITPTNGPSLILIWAVKTCATCIYLNRLAFPLKTMMVINICFSVFTFLFVIYFICDLFYFLAFFQ